MIILDYYLERFFKLTLLMKIMGEVDNLIAAINPDLYYDYDKNKTKLKEFKDLKILKHKKERTYDLYQVDIDSFAYRDLKIYYNISKIR